MAEEEIAQENFLKYQKMVADLCRKVANDPKRYTAYVMQDELPCLIPVSGVLAVVVEDYICKLAAKDAEISRLVNTINTECYKCGDCAKFGSDCSAGDVDGSEDYRACSRFVSKKIASLCALVKELADALENEIDKIEPDYDLVDSLVAKAREVAK